MKNYFGFITQWGFYWQNHCNLDHLLPLGVTDHNKSSSNAACSHRHTHTHLYCGADFSSKASGYWCLMTDEQTSGFHDWLKNKNTYTWLQKVQSSFFMVLNQQCLWVMLELFAKLKQGELANSCTSKFRLNIVSRTKHVIICGTKYHSDQSKPILEYSQKYHLSIFLYVQQRSFTYSNLSGHVHWKLSPCVHTKHDYMQNQSKVHLCKLEIFNLSEMSCVSLGFAECNNWILLWSGAVHLQEESSELTFFFKFWD